MKIANIFSGRVATKHRLLDKTRNFSSRPRIPCVRVQKNCSSDQDFHRQTRSDEWLSDTSRATFSSGDDDDLFTFPRDSVAYSDPPVFPEFEDEDISGEGDEVITNVFSGLHRLLDTNRNFSSCPRIPCMGAQKNYSSDRDCPRPTRSDNWLSDSSRTTFSSDADEDPCTVSRADVVYPDLLVYPQFVDEEVVGQCDGVYEQRQTTRNLAQNVFLKYLRFETKVEKNCNVEELPTGTNADLEFIGKVEGFAPEQGEEAKSTIACTVGQDDFELENNCHLHSRPSPGLEDTPTPRTSGEFSLQFGSHTRPTKKFISILFNENGESMTYADILTELSAKDRSSFQLSYIGKLAMRNFGG